MIFKLRFLQTDDVRLFPASQVSSCGRRTLSELTFQVASFIGDRSD
jgi:hypothetical protein